VKNKIKHIRYREIRKTFLFTFDLVFVARLMTVRPDPEKYSTLFGTCKTHFIFGEKCAHFSALYYVKALHVFLGFSFPCVLKLNLK